MKLSDFDYELPAHLIAQTPLPERSASRLLQVDKKTGQRQHLGLRDLPDLLREHDLLVFNNTRVIPARLWGVKAKTGGRVEVLIERVLGPQQALAQIKASKSPLPGTELYLAEAFSVIVGDRQDDLFYVQFPSDVFALLEQYGHLPLPPYISRAANLDDQARYQTVFAEVRGAVAAPTAGLHFDEALLTAIAARGVRTTTITLHVGAGTFQPIRVEPIEEHVMHAEWIQVTQHTCDAVAACRAAGGRVIAVGTTVLRALESAVSVNGQHLIKPYEGETRIFIYPGYTFQCVDALLTNFHLPKSSLLLLVSAFAGKETIANAYREAILEKYRFFSYGDAMLMI